ncbi:hypothetical protein [Streptomyces sp. NPDC058726]
MPSITRNLALTAVPAAVLVALLPPLTADAAPTPTDNTRPLTW